MTTTSYSRAMTALLILFSHGRQRDETDGGRRSGVGREGRSLFGIQARDLRPQPRVVVAQLPVGLRQSFDFPERPPDGTQGGEREQERHSRDNPHGHNRRTLAGAATAKQDGSGDGKPATI